MRRRPRLGAAVECFQQAHGLGDSRHIVGYIHELADGFEMLWMRPRPGVTYRYDTFEEAVRQTSRRMLLLRLRD